MRTTDIQRPVTSLGPVKWVRKNLFNNWYNSLLTIIGFAVIARFLYALVGWLISANWDPITTRPLLYAVGQYPLEEIWRVGLSVMVVSFLMGLSWATWGNVIGNFAVLIIGASLLFAMMPFTVNIPRYLLFLFFITNAIVVVAGYFLAKRTRIGKARTVLLGWLISLPVILLLLHGIGMFDGMAIVSTGVWGGMMINILLAAIGIAASFPIGVLLALGRRSKLPVVKIFCTLFIELVRGVPLVSILFMASIILPLFLPGDIRIDRLLRALIGITLFSSAYMAENIRGGLQAIPLGQYDAAKAIGLNGPLTTFLIVLPQAIRLVIPAIVGQFISLFKDTTLVVIVGLLDILGVGKSILAGNPEWVSAQAEVYLFIAAVFWVFTFSMSRSSRKLEKILGVGER
ncbi:MAG TPA: amino acid ABC transporter permease [candidate division Zixibacteria bacterium]|nr:amino acid ABC transporter permease [candidate division Zixibacteria bacterium]